jgi:hypothetical protein
MQIIFSDGNSVDLEIDPTPLGDVYQKIYKHLSHVPIPFKPWDNPWYRKTHSLLNLVELLDMYARRAGVAINIDQCLQQNQPHLNYLHKVFEEHSDGSPIWMDFHEHIHICEQYYLPITKYASIDYRHLAGPLIRPMIPDWTKSASTKIKAGEVFTCWTELGKLPYHYWRDGEPDDIDRLCALGKPWVLLQPRILIALEDIDRLIYVDVDKFEPWWNRYRREWSQHWNMSDYTVEQMFSSVVFGRIPSLELVVENFKNNILPTQIKIT